MPPKGQPRPYDIVQRAQALTLHRLGVPFNIILETTGVPKRQVYRYLETAKERGYDPSLSEILRDEYLTNAPIPGRPRALNEEAEEELVQAIRRDRYAREKDSLSLGIERNISVTARTKCESDPLCRLHYSKILS
jgi:transposase